MSFWNKFASKAVKEATAFKAATAAHATGSAIQPYAMERTGDDSAEIILYGDVVSERPTHWWTGEPLDGQYIILSEFLEDLKQVEDVSALTIRIHSIGGNVYDAITIHNRIKAIKGKVTVIIDGVAMSSGAVIACAGDTVQVFPGTLVMIHKCWGGTVGNADALRKAADGFDVADRSQAAIFSVKTGLSTDELLSMMAEETYMTGQEAIDFGFADEMVEGSDGLEVAASADRRTLFAGGMPVWASTRKGGIPTTIPTVDLEASAPVATNKHQPAQTGGQNGGNTMANTLEELRKENPALAQQLMTEAQAAVSASGAAAPTATPPTSTPATAASPAAPAAAAAPPAAPMSDAPADPVAAERQRIQEIDALASLYDAETIKAAKYGPEACTAQEMAYRAAQKAAKQGRQFMAALEADTIASGVQDVGAANGAGGDGREDTPQAKKNQAKADAKAFNERKKEVR